MGLNQTKRAASCGKTKLVTLTEKESIKGCQLITIPGRLGIYTGNHRLKGPTFTGEKVPFETALLPPGHTYTQIPKLSSKPDHERYGQNFSHCIWESDIPCPISTRCSCFSVSLVSKSWAQTSNQIGKFWGISYTLSY